MIDCVYKVVDFMSKRPDSANHAKLTGHRNSVFKLSMPRIKQTVNKEHSGFSKFSISDILEDENSTIIAYPESDINEIMTIMTNLGLETIPVVKTPWDKTLVGFVNIETLRRYDKF